MMNPPIKILHVAISLDAGGMENGIVNIAHRLDRREFAVWVCGLERRGRFAARFPRPEQVLTVSKPPGISPLAVMRLHRLIRELKPDVIHTHNLGPLIYTAAALTAPTCRPCLVHGEHRQLLAGEQTPVKLALRRMLYRRCDRIHTVSNMLRAHLRDLRLPDDRLTVIINGVDPDRFKPGDRAQARRRLRLPENDRIIGMVGALRPEKNHAVLVEAFARLRPEHGGTHLLIVGDGPEKGNIESLCNQHRLHDAVTLAGHQDDTPPWYQCMDLMVLPSRAEGLSNAILEAMACGVPVLAGRACGNAEAIRDGQNGYLYGGNTSGELSAAIAGCLTDDTRRAAIGRQARCDALRTFSLDAMAAAYARLYRGTTTAVKNHSASF